MSFSTSDHSSKFRNKQGVLYTRALFLEQQDIMSEDNAILYTLKNHDHRGYPSLKRLYLQEEDPTEYRFACRYFDSWDHWLKLLEAPWFKPYISAWRQELELKLRAEGLSRILAEARDDKSKGALRANEFLVNKGWQEKAEKGRPSKEEKARHLKEEADLNRRILEDAVRLGLN